MSGNNSTLNNSDWVRLNVGGKVFQTSKDTLSRYPESFLAYLANGVLPSDKDETGAFLIDRDPHHFRVILNYLRNGELVMDRNEIAVKELMREADFYGLHALVEEVNKPIRTATLHTEIIFVKRYPFSASISGQIVQCIGWFEMSEQRQDYEVLQALRQKVEIKSSRSLHYITSANKFEAWMNIESTLRNFGFVKEEISEEEISYSSKDKIIKYVRTIRQ